jgi:hypothetical protein
MLMFHRGIYSCGSWPTEKISSLVACSVDLVYCMTRFIPFCIGVFISSACITAFVRIPSSFLNTSECLSSYMDSP